MPTVPDVTRLNAASRIAHTRTFDKIGLETSVAILAHVKVRMLRMQRLLTLLAVVGVLSSACAPSQQPDEMSGTTEVRSAATASSTVPASSSTPPSKPPGASSDVTEGTPGADQPVTASLREQSEAIARCAAEQGVAVEVDPSGDGVIWEAPEGQEARYAEVIDECASTVAEEFGVAQGPPTIDELESWYRAFQWTHGCMKEQGYPVEEPPTLESYVDSGGTNWHPYNGVVRSIQATGEIKPGVPFSEEAFRTLENTCPQDLTYLLREVVEP